LSRKTHILLTLLFAVILIAMLAVTSWASSEVALWNTPREVGTHPWMIACLFDAYFGFITFFCWVCVRERGLGIKAFMLVSVLLLGNIAMAIYTLVALRKLGNERSVEKLMLGWRAEKEATA